MAFLEETQWHDGKGINNHGVIKRQYIRMYVCLYSTTAIYGFTMYTFVLVTKGNGLNMDFTTPQHGEVKRYL